MTLRYRTKLFLTYAGLVVGIVIVLLGSLHRYLAADLEEKLDQRLEEQARGAAQWVSDGRRHPDKLASRLAQVVHADVTIYDRDGTCVGDSRSDSPSAEATPPEVASARGGHTARVTRHVDQQDIRFVAVPAGDGLVIRLSVPLSFVNATLVGVRKHLFVSGSLALVLAFFLSALTARFAAKPLRAISDAAADIARGNFDVDIPDGPPDEFGLLSRGMQTLARELKAKMSDLVAERNRLSAILAAMAEGVLVVGEDDTVRLLNPAAARILERDDLLGTKVREALPNEAFHASIEKLLSDADAVEDEVLHGDKTIALSVRPLLSDDPARGRVVVLRDRTRLHTLLTMRRDFVANVSHELRTPVTAILGYAETLLRGPAIPPETHTQFLEIIHRQSCRIAELVSRLLRLSELESGAYTPVRLARVHVGTVAENVFGALRRKAEEKSIILAHHIENTWVHADAMLLEQVLLNLVENGIKYGKTRVLLTATPQKDGAEIQVSDDGPGIASEHLPRLFERFYRTDAGRSRDLGGVGLGLAIAKHLVTAMQGSLRVESTVLSGTTFILNLSDATKG